MAYADNGDPFSFWSAVNNQTPEQFFTAQDEYQTQQKKQDLYQRAQNGDIDALNELEAINRQEENANWSQFQGDQAQQGRDQLAGLAPYGDAFNTAFNNNQTARNNNIAGQSAAFNSATAGNAGLLQQSQAARNASNAWDQSTLSAADAGYAQARGMDASNVGNLQALNGTMQQLQASPYVGDVVSDPGLVGMQMSSYNDFGNWASGANDVYSDPGLVGMQQGVYDAYGGFANGDYDLTSQAATAQADAEALAAQKEALGEFRDRMDPKLTDAERFLYMQSRLAQEQSQRAMRDANYRELERRGMGGSTMALSNLNASSAEASNTRALQDLGANAKAIDRAEKALVNYGNMGSTIADQSFQRDYATKSAADRMAINNNQQRLAGIQGQGQMSTAMRNADDAMKNANANRQLEGTKGQAALATDMRNASDAIAMNNQNQRAVQSRFQDSYRADQQQQAWQRGTDISSAQFRQSENLSRDTANRANTNIAASNNAFDRAATTTNQGIGANRDYMAGYDALTGRQNEAMRDNSADLSRSADFALGTAGIQAGAQRDVNATRSARLQNNAEDRRANEAVNQAYRNSVAQQKWDAEHPNDNPWA